jgi:hypothetical protein
MGRIDIYINYLSYKITRKNNSIQISLFNNDNIINKTITTYHPGKNNELFSEKKNKLKMPNDLTNNKVIFIRQKINLANQKPDINSKYHLKKIHYEFGAYGCDAKGWSEGKNDIFGHNNENFIELEELQELIKNIKNDIECEYTFYYQRSSDCNADEIGFRYYKNKYIFTVQVAFSDEVNFYSIVINVKNKNKIILLFEKYLQMVSSITCN